MSAFILLAVAQSEGQVAQIARTFGVDWQHLGAQIISFSIVCAVLHKFAYRRILAMLEQRREQIALGIPSAKKCWPRHTPKAPNSSRKPRPRRLGCSKRKHRKPLLVPNRSWLRRAKPPRRTTNKCSPNSNERSASWWCGPRLGSLARF